MVIGIDTGGTHTDSVLIDTQKEKVLFTSKVRTTHFDLSVGITECLQILLRNYRGTIDRIMLSSTLATNAVIEGTGQRVGVIFIGKKSYGILPTKEIAVINGKINAKGREIADVNQSEIDLAVNSFIDRIDAVAISGYMSIRNPSQEIFVRDYIDKKYNLPIVCGHELSSELGFHERTITAVLNARLLPIISDFISAIRKALNKLSINTELFVVRGDGSISNISSVLEKPVETILSGPTTSVVGARYLTGLDKCIICDMGGTTTDTSFLDGGEIAQSENGAKVGRWKTMIRSLDIHTYGVGGDSTINVSDCGDIDIGPGSTIPSCCGGNEVTPTDILHYLESFSFGDEKASVHAIERLSKKLGIPPITLATLVKEKIIDLIQEECIGPWNEKNIPVVGIGAASGIWLKKWNEFYGNELIFPPYYKVANAIGAAVAGIKESVYALVRPGEHDYGYIAFLKKGRHLFMEKEEAIQFSIKVLKKDAEELAKSQEAKDIVLSTDMKDIYTENNQNNKVYIETRIQVTATGRII